MKSRRAFPNVTSYRDRHGRVRWRYRKAGRTVSLPFEYGSVDFCRAYEAAVNGEKIERADRAGAKHGTFGWLIEQYRQTPAFLNLAESSRRTQYAAQERFRLEHGSRMVVDMQRQHVEVLISRKASTPAAANSLLKLIKKLCRFAIDRKLIAHDPTKGVQKFKENQDGYHTWTAVEIEQFRNHHGEGTKPTLALLLLLYSGGSIADLVKFGRHNVRGGLFRYRRQKTGVDVELPLHADLRAAIAQFECTTLLYITHGKGRPYSAATFGHWWRKQCDAAGLPQCTSHGLRKAGATSMAENGATEWQIMAYLGHRTPDEARTYVKSANRGQLGAGAIAKINMANPVERLANYSSNQLKNKD